jgi:hypothetical protein
VGLDGNQVKKKLQDHLQEGLLIVVGTGLSIAEGIPGMHQLAEHLKRTIPAKLPVSDPGWDQVVTALDKGDNLEGAMMKLVLLESTVDTVVAETACLIAMEERKVIRSVLIGERVLPFTPFLKHLFKAAKKFHIITTNYDRLVEMAAEAAAVGVDSRFFGYLHGRLEPKRSADSHRELYLSGKNSSFRNLPCLCVHKPHGSLDWFNVGEKIIRCPLECGQVPMIITPGTSKYRESFRSAFDDQRTAGNKAATAATRLMFIGYGFNDEHLEQYVCPGLKVAKPTVIVAKHLTDNARQVVQNSDSEVLALSAVSETDNRTQIQTQSGEILILDEELWHLNGFNQGVL